MEETIKTIKKFIIDNKLDFSDSGSSLNGNCVILAGFICHVTVGSSGGREAIYKLKLSTEAETELLRVFEYAYNNGYGDFWGGIDARKEYIF